MAYPFPSLDRLVDADPALRFRSDDEFPVVRHLRGQLREVDAEELERSSREFVRDYSDLFGPVDIDKAAALEVARDPDGGASLTMQQLHADARVLGGSIRFHVSPDGVLDTVSNRLFPDLEHVPARAELPADKAVQVMREVTRSYVGLDRDPELVVVRHEGRPYLAWEVRLAEDSEQKGDFGAPVKWVGYVDATTGELVYRYDDVQTAGPVVASGTGYYSGPGTVNGWFTDTTYQLRDTTRTAIGGPEIVTNDEDGASPSDDVDANWNTLTTTPRDANQGAEVDAHRYTGTVIDYFRTVHGRNSYDGAGATATNIVHLGTDFANGYWNGSTVNLGDGSTAPEDDYECSDDWLAHEWTHAYTQYTCALQYLNESGALNEAISDVFAAFITGDWLVFEDSWRRASAPAWRNMVDPTNGGLWNPADPITSVLAGHQPSHYSQRYTGAFDNGGVHINSGIINNLFYLLTVGGTHTVSGVAVSGVGQGVAEQLLWRCMTVNLVGNATASFLDFREAMLDASLDLFPGDLFVLSHVKRAFNAVGIGPDIYVRDNVADTGDEPYAGGYLWASPDIINRTSPSADPTTEFADLTNDSLWQNVEFGQDNHVYVRLQNRGPQTGDAVVRIYFSAATTFGTPASWISIGMLSESGIAAGTVRIAGPLTFPAASIPAPGHYCMIAVVSSSLDPAPDHTLIASVGDYLTYVAGTNNIAYRNLDVVDAVSGSPGVLEAMVRNLGDVAQAYAIRLDLARFGAAERILVRGPAKILDRARPRGLKLVDRGDGQSVYMVLNGRTRARQLAFLGINGQQRDGQPGFDRVVVDKDFRLVVEYELAADAEPAPGGKRRRPQVLTVRQLWNGRPVGGVGVVVRTK